jgi:hypothetical protein
LEEIKVILMGLLGITSYKKEKVTQLSGFHCIPLALAVAILHEVLTRAELISAPCL